MNEGRNQSGSGKKRRGHQRERESKRERIEKMGVGVMTILSFHSREVFFFSVKMFSPVGSLLVLLQALIDAAFPWSHCAAGCLTLEDGEVPHRDRPILAFHFIRVSAHTQTHAHIRTQKERQRWNSGAFLNIQAWWHRQYARSWLAAELSTQLGWTLSVIFFFW